jgi:Flp pilus assembly protein TadG
LIVSIYKAADARRVTFSRIGNKRAAFASNQSGTTAIEFALVAFPFLAMVFGIINTGMFFYSVNSLDRGLEDSARRIRTGELQNSATPITVGGYKTMLCAAASGFIDCSKVEILIQSASSWGALGTQSCQTAGNLTPSTGTATTNLVNLTGTAGAHVLITACYKWEFAKQLPFLKLGSLSDGSALIQSTTAFKTEPYNPVAAGK